VSTCPTHWILAATLVSASFTSSYAAGGLSFNTSSLDREPVYSVGVGLRMLLSYIPLEFYAAKAFQRPHENIVYGFNIIPGW